MPIQFTIYKSQPASGQGVVLEERLLRPAVNRMDRKAS